jgi:predicted site-specific integrase-resolvase
MKANYKSKLNEIKKRRFREYIKFMRDVENQINNFEFLAEGTKVKLNYDEITSRPDYQRKQEKYRAFVENNKDKIFTVEYDERHREKPYLVCLEEDETPIKWLWHIISDLVVVD